MLQPLTFSIRLYGVTTLKQDTERGVKNVTVKFQELTEPVRGNPERCRVGRSAMRRSLCPQNCQEGSRSLCCSCCPVLNPGQYGRGVGEELAHFPPLPSSHGCCVTHSIRRRASTAQIVQERPHSPNFC